MTDWLALLTAIIPAILGGGAVGAILTALTQHRRMERIDRVEQLAESQQVALQRSMDSEGRLRDALYRHKGEMSELEAVWRKRFDDLEARYEAKCNQIEQRAREREEDYLAEIAMLRADLARLQVLMFRCGIDPEAGTPIPQTVPQAGPQTVPQTVPQTGPLKL